MNIEYFIIGILTVLLLGQQVYWASIVFKLTNRLMSRDYPEFKQAEKKIQQISLAPSNDDAVDLFAQGMADQANKTLGLI